MYQLRIIVPSRKETWWLVSSDSPDVIGHWHLFIKDKPLFHAGEANWHHHDFGYLVRLCVQRYFRLMVDDTSFKDLFENLSCGLIRLRLCWSTWYMCFCYTAAQQNITVKLLLLLIDDGFITSSAEGFSLWVLERTFLIKLEAVVETKCGTFRRRVQCYT